MDSAVMDPSTKGNPSEAGLERRMLPNGMEITFSTDPDNGPKVGETVYISRDTVIPDPNQPRNTTGITDTEEHKRLSKSIKIHGQGTIIKTRPMTREERQQYSYSHPRARQMIVDGESRYWACGPEGADLDYLHVSVGPNREQREIFLAQVVYNDLQNPLNTPDLARALARIQREYPEWSVAEIARQVSMSHVKVSDHLKIATLSRDLLELTNRNHRDGHWLPVKAAVALSQVEPEHSWMSKAEWQRSVLDSARKRGLKSAPALVAFFENYHSKETQSQSVKHEPKRMRQKLRRALAGLVNNPIVQTDFGELDRITETATPEEMRELEDDARAAADHSLRVAKRLKIIRERREDRDATHVSESVGSELEDADDETQVETAEGVSSSAVPVTASAATVAAITPDTVPVERLPLDPSNESPLVAASSAALVSDDLGSEPPLVEVEQVFETDQVEEGPEEEKLPAETGEVDQEGEDPPSQPGNALTFAEAKARLAERNARDLSVQATGRVGTPTPPTQPTQSRAEEAEQRRASKIIQDRRDARREADEDNPVFPVRPHEPMGESSEAEYDPLANKPPCASVWHDSGRYTLQEIPNPTAAQRLYDAHQFEWQKNGNAPPSFWVRWREAGKVHEK